MTRGLAALLLLSAAIAVPPAHALEPAPEGEAGFDWKPPATADTFMIAAAHPLAAEAGKGVLERGGAAIDAAIAAQMVLGLVEPQSSGIGGGAFLLHWNAYRQQLLAYDGRETAPAAATPDRFLGPDGKPLAFMDAVVGGRSVGVPGLLRMLEMAHRAHGRLPWKDLFQPAIALAEAGFPLSPRLHALLSAEKPESFSDAARAYFFQEDGSPKPAGTILRNPELAETLRRIAEGGADAFYQGPLAERIAAAVRNARANPGDMTAADLAGYRAVAREPVCRPYRAFKVCGMPPPTSGGVTVLQILGIIERFPIPQWGPLSLPAAHVMAEAGKLAFADRNRYLADPGFAEVPVESLLDRDYLARRAGLISPHGAGGKAEPGELAPREGMMWGDGEAAELPSTTHLSVVDADGNAVALTSSIEHAFGSRLMVGGFLLNNQLTDFSFRPTDDEGRPVANRVEPGKRPRSSMAPTMAFNGDGSLRLVTGSPGGSRIIGYVARNLVAVLDWKMTPQAAVDLPHVLNRNGPTEVEDRPETEKLARFLYAIGHEVKVAPMTSGLHVVEVTPRGLRGGADPRREGVAVGD